MSTTRLALLGIAAAGLLAGPASADVIDASLTTIATGRPDPRDGQLHTVVPVYELITIRASAIKNPLVDDLALVVSGWGSADVGAPRLESGRVEGDLDVGFAEGRLFDRRLQFRVGRQIVWGGAVRAAQLDGLDLDVALVKDVGASAYAGVPVVPRFAERRGDFIAGGSVYWRKSWSTEIGLSYVNVLDEGRAGRSDVGLDGRYMIRPGLAVTGSGYWSLLENRLSEASLAASWQRGEHLLLSADVRRVSPDLFILRGSIFSVFAETTHDEAGGLAFWQALPWLGLTGDYHLISCETGTGHRTGLRADVKATPRGDTRVGAEARLLTVPVNGYKLARVFATTRPLAALLLSADASAYLYDAPVNGHQNSLFASLSAAWQFARGWQAVVTGIAGENPWLARNFELIGRIVYTHSLHLREES